MMRIVALIGSNRKEYNHSISGMLKNALDWISRVEKSMLNKPVMIVGASMGEMGTVHAQGHLRHILNAPGLRLQRFAPEVRNQLGYEGDERGRSRTYSSVGCEMRFVTTAKTIHVSLSSLFGEGDVLVYRGNLFHSRYQIKEGQIKTLQLNDSPQLALVKPEALQGHAFSTDVWRVFFCFGYCAVYHGIDTFGHTIRPPKVEELPKINMLAYGSSITNGGSASIVSNTYIYQAARRLKADIMNLALGGACLCEKEVVDFIAERGDWDLLILELGENLANKIRTVIK